jgi:HipA-like protein
MARRRAHVPLSVLLNGRRVGVLRRDTSGAIGFQYAPDWLAWDNAFPVSLSLPLREDRYIGAPVINVFDNRLPDSDAIRGRIAERVGAGGTDAYSLLAALGHDCVGALQFLPEGTDPGRAGAVEGREVTNGEVAALRLALAAGRNCHYQVEGITPRHFLQTAALAGIGVPAIRAIFEDLAANAVKRTDAVIDALPPGFPDRLVSLLRNAVKRRAALLADARDASAR